MLTNLLSTTGKMVLAGLLISSNLLANPTNPTKPSSFDASVFVTKANKIRLAVEKKNTDPVSVTLRHVDQKNTVLFNQQMGRKQTKMALQLDVDTLDDGVYELEIRSSTGSIVKQVTLATPSVQATSNRTITMP
ncbi:hypothetical protein [Spirosoma rigui]|uniref:hypothetical protein n=1 Tax=Spirosoma rigui TaxID=564064 RepID=UPI0009B1A029|nr:hypothetical protein [Spirosoma rigui]